MPDVIGIILGGGEGSRLQPLTRDRSKPAVPLAGKYRLVDIPISNCINNGINRIYLLTQFNSVSLHQHVNDTFRFDPFSSGYMRLLAAQQTPQDRGWFMGTADAVRQSQMYYRDEDPEHVLILSGDQLYRLDFREVMREHIENDADVTIATKPVPRDEAGALGIMQVDTDGRIVNFVEKPGDTEKLDPLRVPETAEIQGERYLASMGIYVFKTNVLHELLDNEFHDFGRDIIPSAIQERMVFSTLYHGYWRDIGTIKSFHEANIALTHPVPEFDFYDARAPIYTHMRYLPPSKITQSHVKECLLTEGCRIASASLEKCVIGVRAIVRQNATVKNTVHMGSDRYENTPPTELPPLGVGDGSYVEDAIIDKNVRIGAGCHISPRGKKNGEKTDLYQVCDGIIVLPKNTVVPDGTHL